MRIKAAAVASAFAVLPCLPDSAEGQTAVTPTLRPAPVITHTHITPRSGTQTDPHVSGRYVTFTDFPLGGTIAYVDMHSGEERHIPRPEGATDWLPDISGNRVVFQRSDGGRVTIYAGLIDAMGDVTLFELSPHPDGVRTDPAIGGSTVAWQDKTYLDTSASEISIGDVLSPGAAAVRLTNDTIDDLNPAVSADGSTVVFEKCPTLTTCQIYRAVRTASGWTEPEALTTSGGNFLPQTTGAVTVFRSTSSTSADSDDIHIVVTDPATGVHTVSYLDLPGFQRRPSISGDLILFESAPSPSGPFDLFVYDRVTNSLYQITDTMLSETLSDINVDSDGTVRVVYAAMGMGVDVYALSFVMPSAGPAHTVRPLFTQTKAYKRGTVVPIRLQLLDAGGINISSSALALTAIALVQQDATPLFATVEDAGNANPDGAFRYDPTLQGYAFNLSTKGLASGTWELQFRAGADPTVHTVVFDLR